MPYRNNIFEGARCADPELELDPELWFDPEFADLAKDECDKCPAQVRCFDYAMAGGESTDYGVWGGISAEGRRNMLRYGVVTFPGTESHSPQAKLSA